MYSPGAVGPSAGQPSRQAGSQAGTLFLLVLMNEFPWPLCTVAVAIISQTRTRKASPEGPEEEGGRTNMGNRTTHSCEITFQSSLLFILFFLEGERENVAE